MRERDREALRDCREACVNIDALIAALVKAGDKPSSNDVSALSRNFVLLKLALADLLIAVGDVPTTATSEGVT